MTYPRQIYNIRDTCLRFIYHGKKSWVEKCEIRKGIYHSVNGLLEKMIRTIQLKRGVWNKGKLHRYIIWNVDEQGKLELNNCSTKKFANVSPDLFHVSAANRSLLHGNIPRQSTTLLGFFLLIFTTDTECTFMETSWSSSSLGAAELLCWTAFSLQLTTHATQGSRRKTGWCFMLWRVLIYHFFQSYLQEGFENDFDWFVDWTEDWYWRFGSFAGVGRTTVTLLFRRIM